MKDPDSAVKQTLIELSFLVPHTKARVKRLASMASTLQFDSPQTFQLLSAEFLPPRGERFFLLLEVDEFVDDDRTRYFFVQLFFQANTGTKFPKALRDRPQQSAWAFEELTELVGARSFPCAIEAEFLLPSMEPPTPVTNIPLTIGSRILPVKGIEYGTEEYTDGVRGFRWTKEPDGIKVWMSFTAMTDAKQLPRAWDEHGKTAARYLKEVMGR